MAEEREPDIRDDAREQGTGEGYPESNPEGHTPVEGTDQGPGAETHEEKPEDPGAGPGLKDSPPSKATGNPHAAGG